MIEPAGLVFTAGMPGKTTKTGYTVGGDLALLSAQTALEAVLSYVGGKTALTHLTVEGALAGFLVTQQGVDLAGVGLMIPLLVVIRSASVWRTKLVLAREASAHLGSHD